MNPVRSLPGEYFKSEEIYARETERIFRRHWLCIARLAELPNAGDYLLRNIDGDDVIVLRDEAGELRAFHNTCRHRGTRLIEENCGSVGKAIRCPYHAWTYDLEGRLIAAPNMEGVDGFDCADFPLHSITVEEWEGFAFINVANEPTPFEEAFAPVFDRFRPWRLSELVSVAKHEYDVAANWKLLFQNYNECYHCPRIHPRLNRLSPFNLASNDILEGAFLGGPMQLADGVDSMTTDGRFCGEPFADLDAADRRRVYYYSLFPTLLLSPHPDFVLMHRLERLGIAATRVVCEFLFPPEVADRPDFDPSPAVDFWDETNRQDWHICEQSQLGVASRAYRPGPLSNLESTVAAFDRHYLRTLGVDDT